jgi:hypothetical protein
MAWGNKNNMGSGFRIKDSGGADIGSFRFARWDGAGNNSNTFGIDNISAYMGSHYGNAPIRDRYTQFVITVDYATGKITTNVSCTNPSAGKVFEVALTNQNPVASIEFYGYGVGGNQDRASVIDDVKVTTTIGDYSATLYNYTINYKAGNDIVKTVTGTTTAGDEIAVDTYLWKDDVKYKKADGEPESLTVQEGDNTLDVAVVGVGICDVLECFHEAVLHIPDACSFGSVKDVCLCCLYEAVFHECFFYYILYILN